MARILTAATIYVIVAARVGHSSINLQPRTLKGKN